MHRMSKLERASPSEGGKRMARAIYDLLNNTGNRFPQFDGKPVIPNEHGGNERLFGAGELGQPRLFLGLIPNPEYVPSAGVVQTDIRYNLESVRAFGYPFFTMTVDLHWVPMEDRYQFWQGDKTGFPQRIAETFIGGDDHVYEIYNTYIFSPDGRVLRLAAIHSLTEVYGYNAKGFIAEHPEYFDNPPA